MALKKNIFDHILFEFLDKLKGLRLVSHICDAQSQNNWTILHQTLRAAKEQTDVLLQEGSIAIGAAYDLGIPNFFEGGFLSYGRSHCSNEQMLHLVEELRGRIHATTICMVHEALERFLKQFAPLFFYSVRDVWKLQSRKRFHKEKRDSAKIAIKNTPPYFEEYVKCLAARNCDDLIKELQEILPKFKEHGEQGNTCNVFDNYQLTAYIRHTTVHRSGEVREPALHRQPNVVRDCVAEMTRKSIITGCDSILPTENQANRLLTSAAGLGYTLYRTASKHLQMKVFSLE